MRAIRILLLGCGTLGAGTAVQAQEVVVTGVVRDAEGNPVPARIQSSSRAMLASADSTGAFRISVNGAPAPDRVMELRFVSSGFTGRRLFVALNAPTVRVDVIMRAIPQALEKTIVTGTAGSRVRRTQPGVVATVSVADLSRTTPLPTLPDALQGRVTSVDLTPSDGSVGESQRLWIRGGTSVAISNEPLVFLDGVRIDARTQRATTNVGGQASSRLFDIDPADIDRIEIAKGPAAATLYGADAAAGVIQIFTKRPAGASAWNQTAEVHAGLIEPNWTPPTNYATCGASDILSTSAATLCHGRQQGDIIADNPLARAGLLTNGDSWSARWAASGGTDAVSSNVSINLERQNGTLPQNEFERNTLRLATRWSGASAVQVHAGIGLMSTATALPQNADNPEGILTNGLLGNPLTVGGRLNGWSRTPGEALASVEQRNSVLRATPTVQVTHSLGRLSQRFIAGIDATSSNGVFFVPLRSDGAFQGTWAQGVTGEDHAKYAVRTLDYLGTLVLQEPSRSSIGVSVSAGSQFVQTDEDRFSVTGFGLVSNDARRVIDAADRRGNQTLLLRTRSLGYFGQLEASVRERLFVQLGARADYQSAFGSRVGAPWFPRAGLSYLITPRSAESSNGLVDELRFRAALGTSGRVPPQGEAGVTYAAAAFIIAPGQLAQGIAAANPGNPDLRAERSRELEVGLDADLFHDRAGLELTWFDKRSRDLLFRLPLPPSMGFRLDPLTNIGSVQNRGWELTTRWSASIGKTAELTGQAGLSTLSNRVLDLGAARASAATGGVREGEPLGALRTRSILRVDSAAGRVVVSDSVRFAANAMPTSTGFIGTTLTIGSRWQIAVTFDGKRGNGMISSTDDFRDRQVRNGYRYQHRDALSAHERLSRFGPFVTESGTAVSIRDVLGAYLQDASFVRWREASVTWDMPSGLATRLGGRNASITLAGRNLLLWTRYEGDPESVTYVSELPRGGTFQYNQFNFMSVPQARRWFMRVAVRY